MAHSIQGRCGSLSSKTKWHILRILVLIVAGVIGLTLHLTHFDPAPVGTAQATLSTR